MFISFCLTYFFFKKKVVYSIYIYFRYKKKLQSSNENVSKTQIYPCDYCDYRVNYKYHLKRHQRTHTGEKPYACGYCQFRCSSSENLRKHILQTRKHGGEFVYECKLCKNSTRTTHASYMTNEIIFRTNSFHNYQRHVFQCHSKRIYGIFDSNNL